MHSHHYAALHNHLTLYEKYFDFLSSVPSFGPKLSKAVFAAQAPKKGISYPVLPPWKSCILDTTFQNIIFCVWKKGWNFIDLKWPSSSLWVDKLMKDDFRPNAIVITTVYHFLVRTNKSGVELNSSAHRSRFGSNSQFSSIIFLYFSLFLSAECSKALCSRKKSHGKLFLQKKRQGRKLNSGCNNYNTV